MRSSTSWQNKKRQDSENRRDQCRCDAAACLHAGPGRTRSDGRAWKQDNENSTKPRPVCCGRMLARSAAASRRLWRAQCNPAGYEVRRDAELEGHGAGHTQIRDTALPASLRAEACWHAKVTWPCKSHGAARPSHRTHSDMP